MLYPPNVLSRLVVLLLSASMCNAGAVPHSCVEHGISLITVSRFPKLPAASVIWDQLTHVLGCL